jgi:DNA mismatch repair protein MutL
MKVTLNESGEPIISETGCSPGTVMEITDLFYNTPARLKFLKRPQTELGHVEELVQNLALAYPEVQFSLSLNGKPSFKTRPNSDLPAVLEAVSAGSIERTQLITIDDFDANEQTRLYGVISPPDSQKTSKRWVVTFINRRLVRCPIIAKAVEAAYESLMPQGRYPVAVLFVDMPGELVDVNVHPTKREVRYAHANAVFGFVRTALRRELEAKGFSTYTTPQAPEAFAAGLGLPPSSGGWSSGHSGTAYSSGGGYSSGFGGGSYGGGGFQRSITGEQSYAALDAYAPTQSPSGDAVEGNESTGLSFRVIGQLYRTYILLETPQGLMVVDQHIASERTFFESLTRSITSDLPQSQQWLTALPLDVSLEQYGLLSQQEAEFARLGFTYQLSNPDEPRRTVTLTAVPLVLAERDPVWQFETMLNQLQETGEMKPDMELWIATLACHSAVRAGDVLNHEQMTLVIRQWLGCTLPWTCPHGRPIAHTIKTEQLNQFFERTSLPVNAMSF